VKLLANSYLGFVLLAGLMHFTQGLLIMSSAEARTITATYAFALAMPLGTVGPLFVVVGMGALYGIALKQRGYQLLSLLLIGAQQFVLLVTMFGVVQLIINQRYGDGYEKVWQFIAADQAWLIYLALLHFASLLAFHLNLSGQWWNKRLSGSA
jgi:ABC-type transport system involved in multi-copper enzyme maturation permease subunit